MNQEAIKKKLELHYIWLDDGEGGVKANFTYADCRYADFTGANLRGVDCECADFTRANFIDADLTDADCRYANLTGANFTGANLTRADLTRANLIYVNFTDVTFYNTKYRDIFLNANNKIITLNGLCYPIVKIKNYLRIGCKEYKIYKWKAFTDKQIYRMGGETGFEFWNKHKNMLLNL